MDEGGDFKCFKLEWRELKGFSNCPAELGYLYLVAGSIGVALLHCFYQGKNCALEYVSELFLNCSDSLYNFYFPLSVSDNNEREVTRPDFSRMGPDTATTGIRVPSLRKKTYSTSTIDCPLMVLLRSLSALSRSSGHQG